MANIRNIGIAEGRLVRDVAVFENSDGSRKVKFTLAVQDNFTSGDDSKRGTQYVNLEGFIAASRIADRKAAGKPENGVYDSMHKGDLVGVEYTVRSNNYTDKSGEMVYDQVLFVQTVDLKETKATTTARAAKNGAEAPIEELGDASPFDA